MKKSKPTSPDQFIHFNGFALSSNGEGMNVIFAIDGYSQRLFEAKLFEGEYTFEQYVNYMQSVLDLPEISNKLKKITVVTDVEVQYQKLLKKALQRPVKLICDYSRNESVVKDTRESIKRTWAEYNSSMLFSLAS